MKTLYKNAVNSSFKILKEYKNGKHMDTWNQPGYNDDLLAFFYSLDKL